MTGRQNTNNAPYPSFNTNNQQNRNNTGNVRNNSNRITTTAQQAAPPPDGQLVDAMRNTSLSRTNNRPTGQVMAPSQATASSQASAPSRVSPQVTSSQANAFKTSSFGVNTSQATSTQASASQAATTSESALDLHEDGQPKIKPEDKERFQTIFAKHKGAVSAPTAGMHFTRQLLKRLQIKGVEMAYITLHIGLGTFRPVDVEDLTKHKISAQQ